MKKSTLWFSLAALSLGLAGCQPFVATTQYQYAIDPGVVSEGPPIAAGEAVATSTEISSFPEISIEPEASVGFEDLPDEIKNLFGPSPRRIALSDVAPETIKHNRDIKIQGYTLQIADYAIPISKSIYDLTIEASARLTKNKTQSSLDLAALVADEPDAALIEELAAFQTRVRQEFVGAFPGLSSDEIDLLLGFIVPSIAGGASGLSFFGGVSDFTLSRGRNADLSITQLLSTGATLQLAYAFTRQFSDPANNRLNPLYTHALTLTLAQPLLRGFGPAVTNADIHIAQFDRNASAADFETQVQNQIRQGLDLYWDLVFEIKRYDVQLISYTAALDLLRINEARFEVGDLAFPEVLQARASVEARREQVIRARQRVRDAEDRLKQLMFFQDETPAWELELLPTQELTWREIEFDPEQVLAEAIRERPEIRSRLSRIDRSDLELLKARDQIKPALDLVGSAGAAGLASGGNRAFDVLERVDFNSLSIGLEFSFPLQNRRARFTHKQRAAEKDRALEEYLREVDIVTSDVRFAIRELRTTRERIDITRSRVESEQLNVDAARQRYNVGFVAQFEVLEFQEDLATAQEAHVQAIVDYNKADIALERARGTILQTYGIVFEAPAFRPRREPVVFPIGFD